jgi:hypothetical protein
LQRTSDTDSGVFDKLYKFAKDKLPELFIPWMNDQGLKSQNAHRQENIDKILKTVEQEDVKEAAKEEDAPKNVDHLYIYKTEPKKRKKDEEVFMKFSLTERVNDASQFDASVQYISANLGRVKGNSERPKKKKRKE